MYLQIYRDSDTSEVGDSDSELLACSDGLGRVGIKLERDSGQGQGFWFICFAFYF